MHKFDNCVVGDVCGVGWMWAEDVSLSGVVRVGGVRGNESGVCVMSSEEGQVRSAPFRRCVSGVCGQCVVHVYVWCVCQ